MSAHEISVCGQRLASTKRTLPLTAIGMVLPHININIYYFDALVGPVCRLARRRSSQCNATNGNTIPPTTAEMPWSPFTTAMVRFPSAEAEARTDLS